MSRETLGFTILLGTGVLLILTLMCIAAFGEYTFERWVACPAFGAAAARPTKYTWFGGGCFVQDRSGAWYSTSNYWNTPPQKD